MRRLLLALSLTLASSASAKTPIRLVAQPKIAQAPSDAHLKIFIERHAGNRQIDFGIDGENFSRSSSEGIAGLESKAVWDVWYPHLPCGHYVVWARLSRLEGTYVAQDEIRLLGIGCEEPSKP